MRKLCAAAAAFAGLALVTLGLVACSPAYNWRETPMDGTELVAMLPCKPDKGSRKVPLGGREVEMFMTGCDAEGTTFAIARVNLKDPAEVPAMLAQWRAATLANMGASPVTEAPLATAASAHLPPLTLVSALGKRQDGSPVTLQGVWFARGTQVIHAAIYASATKATKASETKLKHQDASEPFFSGLKFP
jgi:hypothetical protein